MIKNLVEKLRSYGKEGLFHIFGSKMVAQVGGLISSAVVIRHLEKTAYGSYVDAVNLYSYPVVFMGLGMTNVIIQYCSEKVSESRRNAIYRHALWYGNAANIETAKQLLAEAGYPDGIDLEIQVPSNYEVHMQTAEVVAEQLKAANINAVIVPVEWGTSLIVLCMAMWWIFCIFV